MAVDDQLLREIARRIPAVAQPEHVILFGSAATGTSGPDSDIDVLVVETAPGVRRKKSVRLRAARRGLGHPFDVIVLSTEWFEESKNVVGGIAYPANKRGEGHL